MSAKRPILSLSILLTLALCGPTALAGGLKVHGIFSSNMVIQRDKPITVWGWAAPGAKVTVGFGQAKVQAVADGKAGRWEATFPASPADANAHTLTVAAGDEKIEMGNIVIGDIWVMNGQSNMAFGLGKTQQADMETAQAHAPLLRCIGIKPNESETLQTDLPATALDNEEGWVVTTPQTAGGFTSIGYSFAIRLQRALQIPIGIIDNARGGASIESLVPKHMFKKDPLAAKYLASVEKRQAEFDPRAKALQKWQNQVNRAKAKGVPEDKWPAKPDPNSLRSWDIPGKSPSDAASCYNGMFGVFKGLNIKGVLFHQGYNNAMSSNCRPKRYRVLMKLMVEGWREDFQDPNLPVGVIGFCAGSIPQTLDNFEVWSVSGGAFIREAQRLGLADVGDPDHTAYLSGDDVQIPGLHPAKKQAHGIRAARWALNKVYGMRVNWDCASLVSAEPDGDRMVLTFDKPVLPDDMSTAVEGFSIAGKDGKFYRAYASWPMKKDVGIWNTANKCFETTKVIVWSPLVKKPSGVRYAWATSPMGNLKVNGKPWLPLPNFRTDDWDWPESDDPAVSAVDRTRSRAMNDEAVERLEYRKAEEAKRAVEILERLKALGRKAPEGK